MKPIVHAELREAAARGIVPPRWFSAGEPALASSPSPSTPPPCTADRCHHWSEAPADDALDIKYGIEYVWECNACKMRRIEVRASGSGNGNGSGGGSGARTAYAPSIEYVIWRVSCRARGYARDAECDHAGGAGNGNGNNSGRGTAAAGGVRRN